MLINRVVKIRDVKSIKCKFPGCDKTIETNGYAAKFCKEHKKVKYREIKEKVVDNNNQVIEHNYKITTKMMIKCQLEGCNNEFEITISPRTFIFPKFCENHRSEYKRKMFNKNC